jgi:hypothetical protein
MDSFPAMRTLVKSHGSPGSVSGAVIATGDPVHRLDYLQVDPGLTFWGRFRQVSPVPGS